MVLAVSDKICPEHTVLLLPAVGAEGGGLTVTVVVPIGPVHPPIVTSTEYVPVPKGDTPMITGFCEDEEKLFGPVHE